LSKSLPSHLRDPVSQAEKIINSVAAELAGSYGIVPGDRIGIAMRNLPEFLIGFLAATACGAVAVPLNAMWNGEELGYALKDSGAKVLLADPERMKLAMAHADALGFHKIMVRGDAAKAVEFGATEWSAVVANGQGKKPPSLKSLKPEDNCMIMYTSGSTGYPKGVCHTQRSCGTAMKIGELLAAIKPEDESKALLSVPLFHITALCPIGFASIPAGSQLIMMRKWDAGKALDLIESQKVSIQ